MFSKAAARKKLGMKEDFRWRGGAEVSRIESLSDAVFGLAVTLLIISQDVPHTYADLVKVLAGFIPFAACFAQLMIVWYEHYKFYRRYALQDHTTTMLSLILLCVILFYVYPLKFVFSAWMLPDQFIVQADEVPGLFTIYGSGFIAVFLIFIILYRRALAMRDVLELTEVEIWDTRHSMRECYLNCSVGAISILIANFAPYPWIILAGPSYGIIGLFSWLHGSWSGKRRRAMQGRMEVNGVN
jgi:uncharacterized membrane protein